MRKFAVTGMSCAACQARVEKAVSAVPGVETCAVSLLTNSMGVEGTAADEEIIRAVEKAGYGASSVGKGGKREAVPGEEALADRETPVLKRRLICSVGFLLVLMYLSMGHGMWGWPLPLWLAENPAGIGLLELLLAGSVMVINQKFFISGFRGAIRGAPNMDTLVALGSSASFLWSVYALFMLTAAGDAETAKEWAHRFYFESAAMILTLITVGKLLEARSKGKTTDALRSLMKLAPEKATVLREGKEVGIPAGEVRKGDIFLVRPGESIPVDGVILEGDTAVNEAALTGESIPADKGAGDPVSAATVNQTGFIRCEATGVGEDTALSKIIQMVSDAAATKAPIARLADKVAGIFVPTVIGIALLTLAVWLLIGRPFAFALARAISVLVISCPCALGLATPVAIMVASGVGAKNGLLFKTASSLEETGRVGIVVLDKTGTITKGEPSVTSVLPAEGVTEEALLEAAYALEAKSEHPLARAVVREAEKRGLTPGEVIDFHALPGNGLEARLGAEKLTGGSAAFIEKQVKTTGDLLKKAEERADQGETPLLFAQNDRLLGIITVADTVKEESAAAVRALENMGIRTVMLTGDNPRTADAVAKRAGISHVVAGVLPDGKEEVVRKLRSLGKVAMVGDGITAAPALSAADVGMAIGAGTDVAIDAADVVLMKSLATDVPAAIRLSRAALRNIRENLFWAFFYNVIGIPLAAGCFIGLFGWELEPMFGAAAMSLSSFTVVTNALRLNAFRLHDEKRGPGSSKSVSPEELRPLIEEIRKGKEEINMTKTMKIQGMMCAHCEARVKKTLEAIKGVESAVVSHTAGTAVVTLSENVDNAVLKAAVEAQDYPVTSVE